MMFSLLLYFLYLQLRQLNQRGYCSRASVLSYTVHFGFITTFPPDCYPSAAPYAALTKFYGKLIRMRLITRKLLKQLLYPEYLNKMNLSLVRIRHHKTEATIMIKDIHCRDSIINCDSESNSDSSDSSDSDFKFGKRGVGIHSDNCSSSSSNPFGYIRYYNPQTGSEREQTKYESFIDYGETLKCPGQSKNESTSSSTVHISTANIQLQKQYSEESETSSCTPYHKGYMACENLCKLNDNLELNSTTAMYIPTTRQSCPTKFVGNKFNQTSLTTIYIPPWSNSENNITHTKPSNNSLCLKDDSNNSSTTHSSSLEVPVNTLPLPDRMIGELLYGEFARLESTDSDFTDQTASTVIKPPTMFAKNDDICVEPEKMSLNLQNVNFRKHSFNSDKPKRRSSIHFTPEENKRKITSQYIELSNPTTSSRRSICRCGSENCHSPRSSDSGMAGSCSLNSPDFCNANDLASYANQERYSTDMANLFNKYCDLKQDSRNVISLSEIEARNYESECPCTSPFGSTPRTSGQDCVPENVLTGSRECSRTSVTSSVNMKPWSSQPKLHSKLITPVQPVKEIGPQKSQSAGCLLDDPNNGDERVEEGDGGPLLYKSGLYAHWWLKAKLPSNVIKGIYLDTRSPTAGKGMFFGFLFHMLTLTF